MDFFDFPLILGIVILSDFHIFFIGGETTNQIIYSPRFVSLCFRSDSFSWSVMNMDSANLWEICMFISFGGFSSKSKQKVSTLQAREVRSAKETLCWCSQAIQSLHPQWARKVQEFQISMPIHPIKYTINATICHHVCWWNPYFIYLLFFKHHFGLLNPTFVGKVLIFVG